MNLLPHILKLAAGVGMFLFAMYLLEESLKNLSGRNFKLFLQRVTKNRISAVAGGAFVTAVLQSSSMVSLMVLAFVGAGVFTMKNAMAIILGANLGTTLDSWIVATLGFKVNIELVAYPGMFAAGLLLLIFNNRKTIRYICYFLLGFSLLFIGLSFMKAAMEEQVKTFDFSQFAGTPLAVFLLIGFIITLVVQSSSATMALTLSALHAGAITFPPAAAIVLGSETGTSIKILLGSMGGNASKKRVALGNFLFNAFLTVLALVLLKPLLSLITDVFKVNDPLIGLVTFSTLINFLSIAIFLPFLGPFATFLEKFFKDTDASATAFIGNANISEPQTALELFRRETEFFIHDAMLYNLGQFSIDTKPLEARSEFNSINEKRKFFSMTPEEQYEFLKQLQGEISAFYLKLRAKLHGEQNVALNQWMSAARSAMHSVKSIKDIGRNIADLQRSSKDIKYDFFMRHRAETEELYRKFGGFLSHDKKVSVEALRSVFNTIRNSYNSALNNFYREAQSAPIEDVDITTALNFNRELFNSNQDMLNAVKDYLLLEEGLS
ncbi:MAG: Na/Pi cotransporter family protein [Planctomycetota bacterium]